MKRGQLNRHHKKHGCSLIREAKRHALWGNPEICTRTAVPSHTENDNVLVREIYKQLEIPGT